MTRREARDAYRKRMALAIGASIGVHALALSSVRLELPVPDGEAPRPLRVMELAEERPEPGLEVVVLESAPALEAPGAGARASAPASRAPAPPTAAHAAVRLPPGGPRPAAATPTLDLTPAAERATTVPAVPVARPARGILLRADRPRAARGALDFYAASDAARSAEEDEGDGAGADRGVGISIRGPGSCPAAAGIPAIGIGGGLGGLPGDKGMGIIGARPPNEGAINRRGPKIGGSR